MGDRAVIATEAKDVGIYVHWNGGIESVTAFLTYCKIQGFRTPESDNYGWARLCQIIANFYRLKPLVFGEDGLCMGIDRYENLDTDNFDNGTYIIKDWKIIGREFFDAEDDEIEDLLGMLRAIDQSQPINMQLGTAKIIEYLNSHENK